jgi:hypothetical protein
MAIYVGTVETLKGQKVEALEVEKEHQKRVLLIALILLFYRV